ncbi:MAG: tetratricopeptide repeat protein [Bacteroidia bacterium]|nr:tetratricopeptide repeat protein [Bacteroidia bacterium]
MIILGFFSCLLSFAQDKELSDSLEIIFKGGNYEKSEELKILRDLADSETDADKKITYSLQLIVAAKSVDSFSYEYSGYLQKGYAYQDKGDMSKALESFFDASKIASENNLRDDMASINIAIADAFSNMGDSKTAVSYYNRAISDYLDIDSSSIYLGAAHLNLGDEYLKQKNLDSALYHFTKGGNISRLNEWELGESYYLGNVGIIYAEKGQHDLAETNLNQAIDVLTRLGDYPAISEYLISMAQIYEAKEDIDKALEYAAQSLNLAKKHGLKDEIGDSNLKLSEIYENKGNLRRSFDHFKDYIVYRDSVESKQEVQKMANVNTEFEVSKKQLEVDLLNEQKKTQRAIAIGIGIALFLIVLLAIGLFNRNKFMKKTNAIIAFEKQRSEDLLLNILPEETAQELKESGGVEAKKFEHVTVLFTDFKGFTEQSERLSPEALVKSINYYFSKFDEIIEKHDLEKIKTIGDAYMCAGGLPFPLEDHAVKVCQAALEIVEFVKQTKRSIKHDLAKFDIRVGINTGTVVAGVVGTKKFQYDIWGDTVNTASRMESSGEIGKVNISETTYKKVKQYDVFEFKSRGALEAKGKGKIQMYFIDYCP